MRTSLSLHGRSAPERGQAGVETVVLLPVCLLVVAAAVQLVVLASAAAAVDRAAVRGAQAAFRGGAVEPAVRDALPAGLRRGLTISLDGTVVRVRVRASSFVPFVPDLTLSGTAS